METVTVPKELFTKILMDVEVLIDDVELALDTKIRKRISGITSGKIVGKTEMELDEYLKRRGVNIG